MNIQQLLDNFADFTESYFFNLVQKYDNKEDLDLVTIDLATYSDLSALLFAENNYLRFKPVYELLQTNEDLLEALPAYQALLEIYSLVYAGTLDADGNPTHYILDGSDYDYILSLC